ncbi:MAG: hypothetical protein IJ257_02550 [Treponema sp.]|nr:hypothetical protein [Treponema sp.]
MKKYFLALLFAFTFSFVSAEFNDKKLTKFLEFDITSTTNRGIERNQTLFSGEIGLAHTWGEGLLGIQGYKDAFDFTMQGNGWLPFASWNFETARIAIGLGGIYHFQRYKNISSEHDFLFDTVFRYHSDSGTRVTFYGGYAWKTTQIEALKDYVPYIYDRYLHAKIQVDKIWESGFEMYLEHGLHDLYRYPLFPSPHYLIGFAYNLENGLRFSGDVSMRIVDGYTTPPYIDSLLVKFATRFTF